MTITLLRTENLKETLSENQLTFLDFLTPKKLNTKRLHSLDF